MGKAKVTSTTPKMVQLEGGKTYAWCACGKSENQPWCVCRQIKVDFFRYKLSEC